MKKIDITYDIGDGVIILANGLKATVQSVWKNCHFSGIQYQVEYADTTGTLHERYFAEAELVAIVK
ncbi:hypothetical protein KKC52_12655 [bacterium]|nr:hypothetical protein [bacterium]